MATFGWNERSITKGSDYNFRKISFIGVCHPEPGEGLVRFIAKADFDFANVDLDNHFNSAKSSLNKAWFFFLDHPFNCFSYAIAWLISAQLS